MPERAVLRGRAMAAHARGDLATAEAIYRAMLVDEPEDAEALHYLGALRAGHDTPAALATLARSVRLVPEYGVYRYNHALALRTAGRDDEAAHELAAAIRCGPALPEAHYHLGLIRLAEHRFAEAAQAFDAARADPDLRDVCTENLTYIRCFHTGELAYLRPSARPSPPLVSVVIPCVNHGQFVADAVRSALGQSYANTEVVVVEGGSTDATSRAAVAALKHPRLRTLFRSPRRTVGDNRNFGIGVARGQFVCCLDADDMLAPDYIEKAIFCLETLGYDVAGSGVQTFGLMEARRNFIRNPGPGDFLVTNQLSTAALFRRRVWEQAGGFFDHDREHGFVHEDWNFWTRVAAMGNRIVNINWEHLIRYRQHAAERLTAKPTMLPLDQQIAIIRRNNGDVLAP